MEHPRGKDTGSPTSSVPERNRDIKLDVVIENLLDVSSSPEPRRVARDPKRTLRQCLRKDVRAYSITS